MSGFLPFEVCATSSVKRTPAHVNLVPLREGEASNRFHASVNAGIEIVGVSDMCTSLLYRIFFFVSRPNNL